MQKHFKRRIALLLLLAVLITLFCGCEKKAPYEKVYEKHMDLALKDVQEAQEKYVYFRSDKLKELASETPWELKSYEISGWEQLSDHVWAVTATVQNSYHTDPYEIANFVVLIDGEYRVVLGILGLPEDLKADIDYSKYLEMDEDYLGEVRLDASADLPPQEEIYRQYMECALEDTLKARKQYVCYNNEELQTEALQQKWELYSYEITGWEQLSDRLWVVYNTATDNYGTNREIFNFVGNDGENYKIMLGITSLTEEFLDGVDISRFIDDDVIYSLS